MIRVIVGDVREKLADLPDESVHCCVTSPPYFGLRSYLPDGHDDKHMEIGLEPTPDAYVAVMVEVFREVRRVLRRDGTLFLNLGDSYAGGGGGNYSGGTRNNSGQNVTNVRNRDGWLEAAALKPKDLIGIPWRTAFALDQQPYYTGKIKDERDRIWLAAMIDGEGCFFIHKRKAGTSAYSTFIKADGTESSYSRTADTYGVGLEISNTSKEIIDRVAAIAGGGTFTTQGPEENARRKQTIYRWRVAPNEAKRIAQEVYPHLISKQHQARLIINCPSNGVTGAAAHQAMMDLHNGVPTTVDYPEPASLFEPGWYLRQDIIWGKPNPMPESVTDRCTKAHEYLFLLSKSPKYHYDAEAIKEPAETEGRPLSSWDERREIEPMRRGDPGVSNHTTTTATLASREGRNRRSVWTVATQPYSAAHFATFPPALIEPCILAGCPKDCCAKCGAPVLRQTETEYRHHEKWFGDKQGARHSRGAAGTGYNEPIATKTTGWLPSCTCAEVACVVCGLVVDPSNEDRTTSTKHLVSDMREDVSPVEETGRLLQQALLRDTAEHDPAQGLSSVRENISGRRDASEVLQQVLFDEMVGDTSEGIQGRPNIDEPGLRPDLEPGASASPSLRLHDGTSAHDGKEDGPIIDADRSRTSHQRKEDGQHAGQSRAAGKAPTRQQKKTDLSRDLSEVHAHLPGERSCSRCGGRLIRRQAPTQPGTVLDCFGGAGTTGLVADRLQRDAILIELNPAYAAMAGDRITDDGPLFAEVGG